VIGSPASTAVRPATGPSSGRPSDLLMLLPIALALVAEGAWTALLAAFLQEFVLQDPTMSLLAMLLAATAGWLAARRLAPRLGDDWPKAAVALAALVAAIGWLSDPEARDLLLSGGLASLTHALLANIGGVVLGLAFLRGIAHSRVPPDPAPIATMLAIGTPAIAFVAMVGGMVAEPWRGEFLAEAAVDVVVFLVAGLGALTLSRFTLVGARPGTVVDWRRNPAWLALAVALLAAIAILAVVTSTVAGPAIVTILGAIVPPLVVVSLFAGVDRRSVRVVLLTSLMIVVVAQVLRNLGGATRTMPPGPAVPTPPPDQATNSSPLEIGVIVLVTAAAIVLGIVLVRLWMRRPSALDEDVAEERWIDHGDADETVVARRRRRAFRLGRSAPTDAVSAYRALIRDLAGRPRVRRVAAESPAAHAARLRTEGWGSLGLDLLAADYGLVRYGGVELTAAEHRRAVGRSASLRRQLTGPEVRYAGLTGGDVEARPADATAPGVEQEARSKLRIG